MIQTQWIGGKYPGVLKPKATIKYGNNKAVTKEVLLILAETPGLTTAEMKEVLKDKGNGVSNALYNLRDRGDVRTEKISLHRGGGGCVTNRWFLA